MAWVRNRIVLLVLAYFGALGAVAVAERTVKITVRKSDAASQPATNGLRWKVATRPSTATQRAGTQPAQRSSLPPVVRRPAASRPAKAPPRGSAYAEPNNLYGAHLLVDDGLPGTRGQRHLVWAQHLVGRWGYAKTLFSGIDERTTGAAPGWEDYVRRCYAMELIPVIRLGGHWKDGAWIAPRYDKPGDYSAIAQAVRRVVEDLPRTDMCPLYIEVWNEPNLAVEWSGKPDAKEYADFFVQTAAAIRAIDDDRIRILNGGLATDPAWVELLCRANPEFVKSFDVWASHPYPHNRPPSLNHHDKTAPAGASQTIDAYLLELEVLRRHGRADVRVMITETGYDLGNSSFAVEGLPIIDEFNRADYMVRAFRDYWSKWPEVLAVMPFEFSNEAWERFDWVYPDSPIAEAGLPTHFHYQYAQVAGLAKPTDSRGAISGRLVIAKLGTPLSDARVTLYHEMRGATTDTLGGYILPRLKPGKYVVLADKPGFEAIQKKVAVVAGGNLVCDLVLEPEQTETLTGTVVSGDDGKPLSGVKISLEPGKLTATSDREGHYEFPACVPSQYTLRAVGRELLTYEGRLEVCINKRNQHNFAMGLDKAHSTENMISNAGFESGGGGAGKAGIGLGFEPLLPAEYREDAAAIAEKAAHGGRRAQQIRLHHAPVIRQITHYNTARAGRHYLAGAWVRVDTSDDRAEAWISLAACRNDGSVLEQVTVSPKRRVTPRSGAWTWLDVRLRAPAGSERISLNLHAQGLKGDAYFDDVHLSATNDGPN